MNIWCKPLVSVQMPTDQKEKGPLNSKASLGGGGGPKAACPANYYVSGFQLLKRRRRYPSAVYEYLLMPLGSTKPTGPPEIFLTTDKEPETSAGSSRIDSRDGYYFFQAEVDLTPANGGFDRFLLGWIRFPAKPSP
jgi:hypothetical protein